VVITVTSDRGLAGAFNSNILRMTENIIRDESAMRGQVDVIAVGKKAAGYFKYRGIEPLATYRDISDKPTFADAKSIASHVIGAYSAEEIDAVYVAFNRFKNVAEQKPEIHQLLPIERRVVDEAAEGSDVRAEYTFEPDPESGARAPAADLRRDARLPRAHGVGRIRARCAAHGDEVRDGQRVGDDH
jgi:F-type H+-transporting ATPase subunit gamma